MDYKAFEEMTGGIPEKTEIDKLIGYLKIFPPVKYTYSIVKFCGRPQVIFMDACTGERVADCVCHYASYGHTHGLIEAMGAPLVNKEKSWDDVEGCLTAIDIMARICELRPDDIREIVGEDT